MFQPSFPTFPLDRVVMIQVDMRNVDPEKAPIYHCTRGHSASMIGLSIGLPGEKDMKDYCVVCLVEHLGRAHKVTP